MCSAGICPVAEPTKMEGGPRQGGDDHGRQGRTDPTSERDDADDQGTGRRHHGSGWADRGKADREDGGQSQRPRAAPLPAPGRKGRKWLHRALRGSARLTSLACVHCSEPLRPIVASMGVLAVELRPEGTRRIGADREKFRLPQLQNLRL